MDENASQQLQITKQQLAQSVADLYGFDWNYLKLIGKNSEYYFTRFYDLRVQKTSIVWNWAGLLAGPFWLIYRKMYSLGILLLIIYSAPMYISKELYIFVSSVVTLFIALLGNKIYLNKIERIIEAGKAGSDEWKIMYYKIQGGVSYLAIIVTFILFGIIAFILGSMSILPAFTATPFIFDWK